jgi:hypothetical protein
VRPASARLLCCVGVGKERDGAGGVVSRTGWVGLVGVGFGIHPNPNAFRPRPAGLAARHGRHADGCTDGVGLAEAGAEPAAPPVVSSVPARGPAPLSGHPNCSTLSSSVSGSACRRRGLLDRHQPAGRGAGLPKPAHVLTNGLTRRRVRLCRRGPCVCCDVCSCHATLRDLASASRHQHGEGFRASGKI